MLNLTSGFVLTPFCGSAFPALDHFVNHLAQGSGVHWIEGSSHGALPSQPSAFDVIGFHFSFAFHLDYTSFFHNVTSLLENLKTQQV